MNSVMLIRISNFSLRVRWFGVLLALALVVGFGAVAQEDDSTATPATTATMGTEDNAAAAPENGEEATGDEISTNGTETVGGQGGGMSGREARKQRFGRQRSNRFGGSGGTRTNGSTSTNGLNYASFRIVAERNIFDPNRFPRRGPRQETRRPPLETFAFVGTMSYEKGLFAFFSGSSSDYQKALKRDGAIAGYKVASIAPDAVTLSSGTNQVQLRVGMQMRREEGGGWYSASDTYVASAPTSSGTTAATPDSSAAPSTAAPSSAETDPILKRLMQKREQE